MANPVKIKAHVEKITAFGKGTYAVDFKPEGRIPRYKSGQFLHLTVDEFDPTGGFWPESRVFSICSSYNQDLISIIYSVKGKYTKKMEEMLKAGSRVWLKLPYGEFVIENNTTSSVVLVAGGTGVSPFLPYLENLIHEENQRQPIHLFYGIRNIEAFIGRDLLLQCRKTLKNFNVSVSIENNTSVTSEIPFETGRLDINEIRKKTAGLLNPVYYLSGPPAMIKAFKSKLFEMGVDKDNVKIDEWE